MITSVSYTDSQPRNMFVQLYSRVTRRLGLLRGLVIRQRIKVGNPFDSSVSIPVEVWSVNFLRLSPTSLNITTNG